MSKRAIKNVALTSHTHVSPEQRADVLFPDNDELIKRIQHSLNDPRPDISSDEMREQLDQLYKSH